MVKLSDAKIRRLKPEGKLVKLSDGQGLQLWLMPSGSKIWRYAFRLDGRQRTFTIGSFPPIDLGEARRLHGEARKTVQQGSDPVLARRRQAHAHFEKRKETVIRVAERMLAKQAVSGLTAETLAKKRWLLGLMKRGLNGIPVSDLRASDILATVDPLIRRGKHHTANRVKSMIGEVMRYAISLGLAQNDPAGSLKGALPSAPVKHRSALINPAQVARLLRSIDTYPRPEIRAGLQLLALCYPRPGELRLAQWKEFDFSLAVWNIPAAHTKMNRDHRIPLSSEALKVLHELHKITGHQSYVFALGPRYEKPISNAALGAALKRLGYGSNDMQPHGFRTIASTLLNESGLFSADAIERSLAHRDSNQVRAAYARGAHWEERVRMAQWWADELMRLRGLQK